MIHDDSYETAHSVALLWKSDRPIAGTSLPDYTQHSRQTSPAGFEPAVPASEWPQTHASHGAVTWICYQNLYLSLKTNRCPSSTTYIWHRKPNNSYTFRHVFRISVPKHFVSRILVGSFYIQHNGMRHVKSTSLIMQEQEVQYCVYRLPRLRAPLPRQPKMTGTVFLFTCLWAGIPLNRWLANSRHWHDFVSSPKRPDRL